MKNDKPFIRSERAKTQKQPVRQDKIRRSSKYNYMDMKDETIQAHMDFSKRLASLRAARGLSAREMSLSLGQGAGYINNIENGNNLPSMAMFFEICEYLGVTPGEFFDSPELYRGSVRSLHAAFELLDPPARELVIAIAERLGKR